MVEAAGIEPDIDRSANHTLSELVTDTNYTDEELCDDLIHAIATQLQRNDDNLLRTVCETYVKWVLRPKNTRSVFNG